jgi:hypothetical protein
LPSGPPLLLPPLLLPPPPPLPPLLPPPAPPSARRLVLGNGNGTGNRVLVVLIPRLLFTAGLARPSLALVLPRRGLRSRGLRGPARVPPTVDLAVRLSSFSTLRPLRRPPPSPSGDNDAAACLTLPPPSRGDTDAPLPRAVTLLAPPPSRGDTDAPLSRADPAYTGVDAGVDAAGDSSGGAGGVKMLPPPDGDSETPRGLALGALSRARDAPSSGDSREALSDSSAALLAALPLPSP